MFFNETIVSAIRLTNIGNHTLYTLDIDYRKHAFGNIYMTYTLYVVLKMCKPS